MEFYQTAQMLHSDAIVFCRLFDQEVGTVRELQEVEDGYFAVLCMELKIDELQICLHIEEQILNP